MLRARPQNGAHDGGSAQKYDKRRSRGGCRGDTRASPRLYQDGHGKGEPHPRIQKRIQSAARRKPIACRGRARPQKNIRKHGRDDTGVQDANAPHPADDHGDEQKEPDKRSKGRGGGKERVDPREHPRTRHEPDTQKERPHFARAFAEAMAKRPLVPAVPPAFPQKKGAARTVQRAGERQPPKIPFREKTDELRARQKTRSDARSDEHAYRLRRVHFSFLCPYLAKKTKKQKNFKIMSDIVLCLLTNFGKYYIMLKK